MNIHDLVRAAAGAGIDDWRSSELRIICKKGGSLPVVAVKPRGNGTLFLVVDRTANKRDVEVVDD